MLQKEGPDPGERGSERHRARQRTARGNLSPSEGRENGTRRIQRGRQTLRDSSSQEPDCGLQGAVGGTGLGVDTGEARATVSAVPCVRLRTTDL